MSAPIGMISTALSGMLFLASSARSSTTPVGWMPTFLPTMSLAVVTGFFLSEKNVYGCCCRPEAKHLTGISCDTASISDGLDESWPTSNRPDATIATPSMLGPPGWICTSSPSAA